MKIQTLSVIAGTEICQAHCPFCVSRMTGFNGITKNPVSINERNLRKAYTLAWRSGTDTLIITGKGEPTLYPAHITEYLKIANDGGWNFPFVELQTNGLMIAAQKNITKEQLDEWYKLGLTTILLSVSHYDRERNKTIYTPKSDYMDIGNLVQICKNSGLNVRLCCVGLDGFIDCPEEMQNLLNFAKSVGINQVTWRPVNAPDKSEDAEVFEWTQKYFIKKHNHDAILEWAKRKGVMLKKLAHNAIVFDVDGQNLCLTGCLTHDASEELNRQLIFFPDGRLYSDWQYKGSVLL